MTTDLQVAKAGGPPAVIEKAPVVAVAGGGRPYLAFRLAGEVYAIDILRIREIIEYTAPTAVPMMPATVRGVINLRGAVVPVIDLAVRFGLAATGVGKRTCIVIVEVAHAAATHVLGLMVDGVNAVLEIGSENVEPPPSFGTQASAEFIEGMARVGGRFVILLDIERVLSIDEMAAVAATAAA
jgi:purine-binding chemotaxis protein CheW